MPVVTTRTRGRFAPSPSGPLHFGSLIAAVGSYLQAKTASTNPDAQGQWFVRIEDIDTPRTVPGAASDILRTLEQLGLYWDGTEVYQSQRLDFYQHYFDQLQQQGLLYACQCNRARISQLGGIYDGFCAQHAHISSTEPVAWRLKAQHVATSFYDGVYGDVQISPELAHEDYVIKRRDGLFAYQWVVVLDDFEQQITEVVRGADLLTMTPRQQALFAQLGAPAPSYAHLPLAVTAPGQKLSKQNHATDIRLWPKSQSLVAALTLLGHTPPLAMQQEECSVILQWALAHWQLNKVPKLLEVTAPEFG